MKIVASAIAVAAAVLASAPTANAQGTAGVPASINVGNGQTGANIPSGLGGSSTGTPIQFTPGAAASTSPSPYYVATNAAESATLASLLTHYSQGISAAIPTTGPPAGISTGIPGGFTGSNTISILDGSITTIPNAATTYTGPRSSSSTASVAAANSAAHFSNVDANAKLLGAVAAISVAMIGGAAWIL